MLVIHPADHTTAMLSLLYAGCEARVVDCKLSNKVLQKLLHHTSMHERILLLGHGSDQGLFYRVDDKVSHFDGLVVGHGQSYLLRKHGGNMIGIWCHADTFARREGLHGLFSGMVVSELSEAAEYGIVTNQEAMDASNRLMFTRLRSLLDADCPLHLIPEIMRHLEDEHTPLTRFNYHSFYYL